jgi:hypothetical protein
MTLLIFDKSIINYVISGRGSRTKPSRRELRNRKTKCWNALSFAPRPTQEKNLKIGWWGVVWEEGRAVKGKS